MFSSFMTRHILFFARYPHWIDNAISFWKIKFWFSRINVKEIIQKY